MILVTDIGNSDIVFGIHDGKSWQGTWRHPSTEYLTAQQTLDQAFSAVETVDQAILSSVVPGLSPAIQSMIQKRWGRMPVVMQPALYQRLSIQIDNPWEIGSDLVANALYAYEQFKAPCVVVDFGTALTFTSVAASGYVMGVAIAPGLKTAMRALSLNTAQLPQVPLSFPPSAIGKNTAHAIQAGIMMGYVGLVKEILDQITLEMGPDTKVLATGGLVSIMEPLHARFELVEPLLTLEGLRLALKYA